MTPGRWEFLKKKFSFFFFFTLLISVLLEFLIQACSTFVILKKNPFSQKQEKTEFWHYQALNVNRCKGFSSEFKGSKVDFRGGNYHLATFTENL